MAIAEEVTRHHLCLRIGEDAPERSIGAGVVCKMREIKGTKALKDWECDERWFAKVTAGTLDAVEHLTPTGAPPPPEEWAMATYIMFSRLTDEGRKTLKERPERLKEVNQEIERLGARVDTQYALLGAYDFINIVEAPTNEVIARISVQLGARGTVQLTTLPAIGIDAFTQMLREGGTK